MNIYVVNIILTLAFACIFLWFKPTKRKKKIFCALVTLNWILISGLRGLDVGADTRSYRIRFLRTTNTSWSNLFKNFYVVYVDDEGKDPGYSVFEKTVQLFTDNYQVYLVIVAAVFFIAMAVWIYKNSAEPCMSYLLFSAFLSGFYAVTGIRQTLATVLVVFIGTKLIKERKLFPFIIVVLIAFTIHKSAICMLPFYFISRIKIDWKYIMAVLVATPLLFIFNRQFMQIIGYIVGYEYEELENRGAYGFTFFYFAVVIVMILLRRQMQKSCPDYRIYYNALFMGMIFLPLVFVNPTTMRVVQYFSIYLMLSIPAIIKSFEQRFRPIIHVAVVFALMFATNIYSYEYQFFWQ